MGVNDISQIANKELAGDQRFTRYLVKPEVNEAQRMNYDIEAKEQIKSSDIICVYGMSLGETDRLWWNLLVEWMNMSGYHQLVFFKYMPEYSESNQFDRINAEFELLDHLSEYCSNSSINVEGMRNRIHIAINKNIFEMQLNRQNINERGPFNRHDKTGRITELQNV